MHIILIIILVIMGLLGLIGVGLLATYTLAPWSSYVKEIVEDYFSEWQSKVEDAVDKKWEKYELKRKKRDGKE